MSSSERAEWFIASVRQFLSKHPVADPSMAEWAGQMIAELDDTGMALRQVAVQLRMAGKPLTAAEKKERGIPVRLKIGHDFVEALTDSGAVDIAETAEAIAAWPIREWSRNTARDVIIYDRTVARIIIFDDNRTCAEARKLFHTFVDWNSLPTFPLFTCDRILCRCSFDRAPPAAVNKFRKAQRESTEGTIKGVIFLALIGCLIIWVLSR